ncbi:MAG: hypothetical protein M0Q95_20640 [Porticoccaceae bacterium]|nr:hypothetical protein [Porticoccaceae bacterium]
MREQLAVLLFSFGVAWLATRFVLCLAAPLGLIQAPNHRSSHVKPTATGGGVGMVVAITLVAGWFAVMQSEPLYPLLLGLLLATLGLWDDMGHVPAGLRFGVQLLVVGVFLLLVGVLPAWDFPGLGALQGWPLLLVLLVAGVWWVNLFNFMDGIDGLAGVQGLSMLAVAAGLLVWVEPAVRSEVLWLFILCIAAAILGFLAMNWPPAKIFMGDVGSTWLSFIIFTVALLTIQRGWLSYGCWLVLASVFVIDASITLFTRLIRGERWYEAHRSHAYQHLARRWQGDQKAGHRKVTVLVMVINVLWLAPWAVIILKIPAYTWAWLVVAWTPIVAAVLYLKAGQPEKH